MIADRGVEPQSAVEYRRDALTASALAVEPIQEHAGGALVRALKAMGLWSGKIAFDHAVIREVAERHGCPGMLIPGDNVLRWIRIKKSPLELDLMRRGAGANAAAVNAVVSHLRAGASYSETRRAYAIESARAATARCL